MDNFLVGVARRGAGLGAAAPAARPAARRAPVFDRQPIADEPDPAAPDAEPVAAVTRPAGMTDAHPAPPPAAAVSGEPVPPATTDSSAAQPERSPMPAAAPPPTSTARGTPAIGTAAPGARPAASPPIGAPAVGVTQPRPGLAEHDTPAGLPAVAPAVPRPAVPLSPGVPLPAAPATGARSRIPDGLCAPDPEPQPGRSSPAESPLTGAPSGRAPIVARGVAPRRDWVPILTATAHPAVVGQATPPTIEVRIGRVEVRALMDPKPAPRTPRTSPAPALTLAEYLKRREGGRS